ncbi:10518_t:CDS:2, partial [Funneliformis geosporum]
MIFETSNYRKADRSSIILLDIMEKSKYDFQVEINYCNFFSNTSISMKAYLVDKINFSFIIHENPTQLCMLREIKKLLTKNEPEDGYAFRYIWMNKFSASVVVPEYDMTL